MENQVNKKQPTNKNKDAILITLIVLLLITNGVLIYMYNDALTKIDTREGVITDLGLEKVDLETDLNDMLAEYDSLQTDNEVVKEEMEMQRNKIQELLVQAKKHKNDTYIIYKLKKEAGTLREIMKGYVHTIDSLNTLNIGLRADKVQINKELTNQKEKYSELEGVNSNLADKVKIGSRLKANSITVIAQRVKSNNVHRETRRASRTDKIKSCFVLEKNAIAKVGKRLVYLRIIAPNGSVLPNPDGSETFEFNGAKGDYSLKREVQYEGIDLEMCVYWDNVGELKSGEYIIEIYSGKADIGISTLTLK